ncbi:PAS domain-containing protein [bacterium]|nr:PAS domain-containing protein [bacterium]
MLNNNQETTPTIQGIPAAVFVIDTDHVIRYWNGACEAITGIPADQVAGRRGDRRGSRSTCFTTLQR